MLGKILKYDLKWVYKVVAIFYILSFIFSVIGRALNEIENSLVFSITAKIAFGIAISMMANSLINCLMRLWSRFIKNLYKDESYLTHTLPVDKKTLYLSKIITTFISLFISVVVVVLSIIITYGTNSFFDSFNKMVNPIAEIYNIPSILLIIIALLILYFELLNVISVGLTGIILGHRKNNNKIGYSVLFGFIVYTATQLVSLGTMSLIAVFDKDVLNILITNEVINVASTKIIVYAGLFIYILLVIILNIINIKLFKKGVNVD